MGKIEILTVIENQGSANRCFLAEFGLSFYIKAYGKNILFDCGSSGKAIKNLHKLNRSIEDIDYTILSHNHFDHAGGYLEFLRNGLSSQLFIGHNFWEEKYAHEGEKYTYLGCGFSQKLLQKQNIKITECQDILEIMPRVFIFGNFSRTNPMETIPARFEKMSPNGMVKDDFSDEICLSIEVPKGLIVILGCSHPGILNMLDTIKKRSGKQIYAVFGGAHLKDADEKRVLKTIQALQQFGIQFVGLNHCSGEVAEKHIKLLGGSIKSAWLHGGDCVFL